MLKTIDSKQMKREDDEAFAQTVRIMFGVIAAYLVAMVVLTKAVVPLLVLGSL